MHSKIKELKDRATKEVATYSHGAFGEPETHYTPELDIEEFARLIIIECMRTIHPDKGRHLSIDREIERYKCIDEIYSHFN